VLVKLGSLFSGYGGLDAAVMAHYGCELAWVCEMDPDAAKVLAHHHPEVPNLGDITAVDWTTVPDVDVICGGFPCQDISSAGKREGITGARSGLWTYYVDAVRTLRPRIVVVENVSALLVRGLDVVLADLASLGYDTRWGSVRASDAGAPHRRERIFLVATDADGDARGSAWGAGEAVGEPGAVERSGRLRGMAPAVSDGTRTGRDDRGLPPQTQGSPPDLGADVHAPVDACATAWGRYEPAVRRWEHLTRPAPSPVDDRGRLNPPFVEWMMGLPEGHVTDHVSRTAALRMLGNGVVPQQAFLALSLLDP
jgi:DNA (cytosine-5)-methyltransferase 1